jgi:hypothetical protein
VPIRTSHPRLTALLLAAVALPLTLAACSSSATSAGSTTTRATGRSGTNPVCALVTPAQIQTTLDRTVGPPSASNSTGSTACTYPATNGRTSDSVIITFRSNVTAAEAAAEEAALQKSHATVTPISVTGAQAFSFTTTSGTETVTGLVTIVGESQLSITSTATLDQTESLSQEIFSSLSSASASSTTGPAG